MKSKNINDFKFLEDCRNFILFRWDSTRVYAANLDDPLSEESSSAYFLPDFFLQECKKRCLPALHEFSMEALEDWARGRASLGTFSWKNPHKKSFQAEFEKIQEAIHTGKVSKALIYTEWESLLKHEISPVELLAQSLSSSAKNDAWLYLYSNKGRGFLGWSPEILFSRKKEVLESMALAGTLPFEQQEELFEDAKILQEQRIVLERLQQELEAFGSLRIGDLEIKSSGQISHLMNRLHLKLEGNPSTESLIRALHPSPAVGVEPKTTEALELLHALRSWQECRRFFASPFVLEKSSEESLALVAIRQISWDAQHLWIPVGCGITAESQSEDEWQELNNKMKSVEGSIFG